MKLTELDPRWFAETAGAPRIGLTFDCPCCRRERLGVRFHRSAPKMLPDASTKTHTPGRARNIWQITSAEDFAVLTLTPSLDASKYGHWHGFIRDGEVT